jgi:hypothetical protein
MKSKTQCPLCHNFENHQANCRIGTLELELNEAREKLNSVFCPWCQTVYPKGDDGNKAVLEHLSICLKHPITERDNLQQQLTTAQQEIAELKHAAVEREKWWNQTIINAMARMQEAVSYVAQFSKDSAMKGTKE